MNGIKANLKRETLLTHGAAASDKIILPDNLPVELLKRTANLFEAYEVEQFDWMTLALKLAKKHEPEFQVEVEQARKNKTKPKTWHEITWLRLWFDVECLMREKKRSIDMACKLLSKRTEWQFSIETLKRQYHEVEESELVKVCMKLEAQEGFEVVRNGLNDFDWDRIMLDVEDRKIAL